MECASLNYTEFLEAKEIVDRPSGHECKIDLSCLFPFQVDIVKWATRRGRAAIFADCGLGKSLMQLKWAESVVTETGGRVLILAPLSVSVQTVNEGKKFGVHVNLCRTKDHVKDGINITNYEMLHHFDPRAFSGVVIDESGIMKNYSGKVRNQIINSFTGTPYRLACTATPAPNDYMELGNHAEFLGVMSRTEMLAMFFVHDGGDTSQWRLKKHGVLNFWKWLSSWSVMVKKPSDLGYPDDGFSLPNLNMIYHTLPHEIEKPEEIGQTSLFKSDAKTLGDQRLARKTSIDIRLEKAVEIICQSRDQWLIWCDLNSESTAVSRAIPGAIEITGSDPLERKESSMMGFANASIPILVTKPKIAGHGMNWQTCHNMIFFGLSHSYESFYQAVRRCWRFGQKHPVNVHIIMTDIEQPIVESIQKKHDLAEQMAVEMVKNMADFTRAEIMKTTKEIAEYAETETHSENWSLYLGDCVEVSKRIPDNSIGYSIFSPPFSSLFTYSNSPRDMGNCKSDKEFMEHFKFMVQELYRITMDGRLVSFHCMNLPTTKERDGFIGIRDFRGDLVRLFQSCGWIFHSEVCIWKDPLIAATRTKAIGLLHKQLCKDSSISRQGIADYVVTMRKTGSNMTPINHHHGSLIFYGEDPPTDGNKDHQVWRRYASPVWMDISQTNTLQYMAARDNNDERHLCPLQIDVVARCIELWSNPGDTVFTPFAGIGTEVYQAVKMGRKGIGIELKPSYYKQAIKNLESLKIKQLALV